MTAREVLRGQAGQSSVEAVALLPLVVAAALALVCGLSAGRAHELAAQAAGAGAMALIQDADPLRAARAAVPAVRDRDISVRVRGARVQVTVRPQLPVPALDERLAATVTAHAGREPSP